jgi:tetratricopeptide (TPR) repeat protein
MKFSARKNRGQAQGIMLIVLALAMLALFILTTLVVTAFAKLETSLGNEWYQRGVNDLRGGNAEQAVIDLRSALSYSREESYRLELARALVAAGRTPEAREYLLSLWERQPGSAELNLELARVSAISQAVPAAIGYYDAAIYGAWDAAPELNRRNTRLELARFLVERKDKRRALAVLYTVASDLPPDPQIRTDVGTLLLQAGDARNARQVFEAALATTRNYVPALEGAGEAALATNDFPAAEHYLAEYLRESPDDQKAVSLLATARTALALDPLQQHINAAERRKRAIKLFNDAQQRVAQCVATLGGAFPPADLQTASTNLAAQAQKATESALRSDPDLVDDVFSASVNAVVASSKDCGPRHPMDDAINALAQLHGVR